MILANTNIAEWKKSLDEKMSNKYGLQGYSETQSDDEWLDNYIDKTDDDAIEDEIENWED